MSPAIARRRRAAVLAIGAALAAVVAPAGAAGAAARVERGASLPKAVRLARGDAAKRRHVKVVSVHVVSVKARTWPDGCLGLPRHGEMCSQLVTAGYRATFSVRGHRLVYRTDRNASFRRESG
ncbi:MAG TPA: hypothetical protein VGF63_03805 [Solirubrobacteraceae bacterium]